MRALKQGLAICAVTVMVLCAAALAWKHWDRNTSRLVEGSEAVYTGVVTDRAMSMFQDWPRGYISIELVDGTGLLFWEARGSDSIAEGSVGDLVRIESAVEAESEVLVALSVTILEKAS